MVMIVCWQMQFISYGECCLCEILGIAILTITTYVSHMLFAYS